MKFRSYSFAVIAASLIAGAAFAQGTSAVMPATKPATTVEPAKADMSKQVATTEKTSATKTSQPSKKVVARKKSTSKMVAKSANTEVKPADTKVSSKVSSAKPDATKTK